MNKEPVWTKFLTPRDRAVFAAAGFGAQVGFGRRPALLIVDVTFAFCGDKPEPILESIKRWPLSCGEEAWTGIAHIKGLAEAARAKSVPVIYTTGTSRSDNWDSAAWARKNARHEDRQGQGTLDPNHIIDAIAPRPGDIVVTKPKPSGFFATPLQGYLTMLGCDSLLITGTTTSGCVRATVVDAFSGNYRVAVVEQGCFDRSQASHALALCDMHAKYADVVDLADAHAHLDGLPAGLFDLPNASK